MNRIGAKLIFMFCVLLVSAALYVLLTKAPATKVSVAKSPPQASPKKAQRVKPPSTPPAAPRLVAAEEPSEPQENSEPEQEHQATEPPKEPSPKSAEVQQIIRQSFQDEMTKRLPQVRDCYLAALERTPELGGRIDLSMVVEGGDVIDVAWDEDSTYDDGLISCVEDSLIGMQVDHRMTGDVRYPLLFSPE